MAGFAKGILIAMLVSVAMIIMMNLAFFFPWYITVIETTFEVSQIVANENYLPNDDYQSIYNTLKDKPIFEKRAGANQLYIKVTHENGKNGIETSGGMDAEDYYDLAENRKPYVQRGNPVKVVVKATYPFQMNLMGRVINLTDIPIEMTMRTTTLKYYKDLDYYVGW